MFLCKRAASECGYKWEMPPGSPRGPCSAPQVGMELTLRVISVLCILGSVLVNLWLSCCPSVWTHSCLMSRGCLFWSPGQDNHHHLLLAWDLAGEVCTSFVPDSGKDWRQEEKMMTEDEMVGWHHWLNGHELSKFQEIVKDRETWYAMAHGVAKSQTRLSNEQWQFKFYSSCNDHTLHDLFESALKWLPCQGRWLSDTICRSYI